MEIKNDIEEKCNRFADALSVIAGNAMLLLVNTDKDVQESAKKILLNAQIILEVVGGNKTH